ncbi:hypothetical protein QAD02_024085 [Eretmocerus hayati]|uniref:Uncharacterized protein n=1 Tax=Eretmocerus hayati TaxID=131215 RepID=A0ACC2Q2J8_9HYME|nr:hypothetical protein QAD02_024085 [Eretmocerus hayati]
MKFSILLVLLNVCTSYTQFTFSSPKPIPVIVTTWKFRGAAKAAWDTIHTGKGTAIDAIENGCSYCEDAQCDGTVGYGGSPDERGETTLDAMLMDGASMDVGAVGGLQNIKKAISVARHVLENTDHSLLVGNHATDFALSMGFRNETLQTQSSRNLWIKWKSNNCQPNFWKNVSPNPTTSCGPYTPRKTRKYHNKFTNRAGEKNHDTISMLAIDTRGNVASGTSTNGARNKIPGRVGDSPIPGAGSYADQDVGAAAATGDGDIMMRFLPSFLAVELMRHGYEPKVAADVAVKRITKHYPNFFGAVVALRKDGVFGAACNGMDKFPFYASNLELGEPTLYQISCT